MTYTLGEKHDKHYTCTCSHFLRGQLPKQYKKNWICGGCHQQLRIFMDDGSGPPFTVTRHKAKNVQIGDHMVYQSGWKLADGIVNRSHQHGNKTSNWFLAVEGHGSARILANAYVNLQ